MSDFDTAARKALALPADDRGRLAERLLHSLELAEDPEIKAAWSRKFVEGMKKSGREK